jgi:hypothetical protein
MPLAHPFDDARLRLGRANEHIGEFEAILQRFMAGKPWAISVGRNNDGTQYVHKFRVREKLDGRIKGIAADALQNLRSALDLMTAACVRLGSGSHARVKGINFPFADDAGAWEKDVKRKCRFVPHSVVEYFRSLEPHGGGDELLYALNSVRNDNEHWSLSPTTATALGACINAPGKPQQFFHIPDGDTPVDEVELFTTPDNSTNYNAYLVVQVRLEGHPALKFADAQTALRLLAKKVTEIVDHTEGLMRTAGLIA